MDNLFVCKIYTKCIRGFQLFFKQLQLAAKASIISVEISCSDLNLSFILRLPFLYSFET